jgi:hypothetical protein
MPIPLPVIPDVFRCALEWTLVGTSQTAVNVIHIHTVGTGKTSHEVFTALDAHVTANMWGPVNNFAGVQSVAITPLDGVSPTTTFPTGLPAKWTGTTTGDTLVAVAGLVKFTTAFRGRNRRGRIYLPFTGESATSQGAITPSIVTAANAAWATFIASISGDATTPETLAVASYDRRHAGAGASVEDVFLAVLEPMAATQRRRQTRIR